MSELESLPEKVAGGIPYFFYDLFGRIVPGLFLIFGLCFVYRSKPCVKDLLSGAQTARIAEWVVGATIVLVLSFVLGFLLSDLSRFFLWRFSHPVTLAKLRDLFGSASSDESSIEVAFKSYFGFGLDFKSTQDTYLIYCGRLCEFVIVYRNSALDSVNVRVAAEELLSRSLVVASAPLSILALFDHEWWIFGAYFGIAIVSFHSYLHYQRKAIREKFQMFLALSREDAHRAKSR